MTDPTISLSGVSVARGHQRVLDVEHLELNPGVIALVGPNGSGKSTLLHALAGLLPSGSITIHGQKPRAARANVAYVMQSHTRPSTFW